jgi:hypothetical protein
MHARWYALIHRGIVAGAADAALEAVAVAAVDDVVQNTFTSQNTAVEEEEDNDEGWGEWGDESTSVKGAGEPVGPTLTGAVVSESEAKSLVAAAAENPAVAAKVALALPYPSLRPGALAALVNDGNLDDELTALILRAEVIPSLLSTPALYQSVCDAVSRGEDAATVKTPHAVASLSAARCHAAAARLAMSAAGLHPALVTNDAGVAVLERYLRAHSKRVADVDGGGSEAMRANRVSVRGKCADGLKALLADLR